MRINLLISALFIFSITTVPLPLAVSAATSTTTVLDVDGQKLQSNKDYYILPVVRGRGGGLALAQRNGTCPFYVSQENMEVSNGLPLKFRPVDPKDKFVQLSTDLNFVFSAATICVQSTVWRLGGTDEVTGRTYVTTGGRIGSPGIETLSNWFAIQRYRHAYKLFFCPTVCSFCRPRCGDIGVFQEDGKKWLGLSDVPFPVMFKKV